MIDPGAAAVAAERHLRRMGGNDRSVAAAYAHGRAGAPLAIDRLDRPTRPYYLVPWRDARGISLVVNLDAVTAALASVTVLPEPIDRLVVPLETARDIAARALAAPIVSGPRLVWQPCREGSSPLQPFYEARTASEVVYVGADGTTYPALTPFGRGGG